MSATRMPPVEPAGAPAAACTSSARPTVIIVASSRAKRYAVTAADAGLAADAGAAAGNDDGLAGASIPAPSNFSLLALGDVSTRPDGLGCASRAVLRSPPPDSIRSSAWPVRTRPTRASSPPVPSDTERTGDGTGDRGGFRQPGRYRAASAAHPPARRPGPLQPTRPYPERLRAHRRPPLPPPARPRPCGSSVDPPPNGWGTLAGCRACVAPPTRPTPWLTASPAAPTPAGPSSPEAAPSFAAS